MKPKTWSSKVKQSAFVRQNVVLTIIKMHVLQEKKIQVFFETFLRAILTHL